jgi:hypothetical protein
VRLCALGDLPCASEDFFSLCMHKSSLAGARRPRARKRTLAPYSSVRALDVRRRRHVHNGLGNHI